MKPMSVSQHRNQKRSTTQETTATLYHNFQISDRIISITFLNYNFTLKKKLLMRNMWENRAKLIQD